MEAPPTTCVVVPTYNERENVAELVDRVEALCMSGLTLLFVDDSSPDGTAAEVARLAKDRPWVKLLLRKGVRGFSSAYQDGFREAASSVGPAVLVGMDADLQHPPSAIPSLVEAIAQGADVAVGSRYVEGGGVVGWSRARRVISSGANSYARLLLNLPVRDCTSGFKAFTREAAAAVAEADLRTKRFEYQIATLNLLKRRFKIVEVPYAFVARKAGKSKFQAWDMARFFVSVARMAMG